ncbi:hypothetical protein VVD49_08410 [Uliginosibacterium sp. H3]|uniref:Uncharacterized protein n=1 Tax=Uliginosibacterium silvisoli TaxID=3114758 RepID=A0ABU6K1D2_9RHOO|nr:hypothetical protein [Uliginosibacterium sp. H3]
MPDPARPRAVYRLDFVGRQRRHPPRIPTWTTQGRKILKENIVANWFKEEIAQFGETVDSSIQKASTQIQTHIDTIGEELNKQRSLTKADVESLIDYAALKFGTVLDERVEKAKTEFAALVTEKVAEVRTQLSEAADEQKKMAVRNATVAVGAALLIGILSLAYRKVLHGEVDLLTIFRISLLAMACGQLVWLAQRYLIRFMNLNRTRKNMFIVGSQYIGVLSPKGALSQLLAFLVIALLWLVVSFWPQISLHLSRILG